MTKLRAQPMQPLELDDNDVVRFRRNRIIDWLFDMGKIDLNVIVAKTHTGRYVAGFSPEDLAQVLQLLGYSVDGFLDLGVADGTNGPRQTRIRRRALRALARFNKRSK